VAADCIKIKKILKKTETLFFHLKSLLISFIINIEKNKNLRKKRKKQIGIQNPYNVHQFLHASSSILIQNPTKKNSCWWKNTAQISLSSSSI
jgi:hypothetical protein